MNYLVMETHPAYAVLLDEEGRFLKAANLHYQVGDTVHDIVELQTPRAARPAGLRALAAAAGLAACLCLTFFGYYQPNFTPYGTLRIQINPDVEMTVSRTDRVLELEGLNADGEALLEGYDFRGKTQDIAAGELVDRAMEMGYLSAGETVSITVNGGDEDWRAREESQLQASLEARYGQTIVIRLGDGMDASDPAPSPTPPAEVVIPVEPPAPTETPLPSAPPSASPSAPPQPVWSGGDDDGRDDDQDNDDDDDDDDGNDDQDDNNGDDDDRDDSDDDDD